MFLILIFLFVCPQPTPEYWQVIFLTTGIIGLVITVLFLIWGSTETQPWNQGSKKTPLEISK